MIFWGEVTFKKVTESPICIPSIFPLVLTAEKKPSNTLTVLKYCILFGDLIDVNLTVADQQDRYDNHYVCFWFVYRLS